MLHSRVFSEMYRNTRQNEAIRKAIETSGRPLTPKEILELAREEIPGLGIATVYRALKRLVDEGQIAPVPLPGEPPRYESGAVAAHHHHHFHCDDCGRVFDVPGCPGNLSDLTPPGFRLNTHQLVLYGQCAACAAGGEHG